MSLLTAEHDILTAKLEEDSAFLSLRRGALRANAFTPMFAVCNEPVRRKELINRLCESLSHSGIPLTAITLNKGCDNILEQVKATVGNGSEGVIIIDGLESGIAFDDFTHKRIISLNQQREEWRDEIPCAVIFWLPEYLLELMACGAPDFLDWRVGTYFFLKPKETAIEFQFPLPFVRDGIVRLNEEERLERINRLRQLIKDNENNTSDNETERALNIWRMELADHLIFNGHMYEAFEILVNDVLLPAQSKNDDLLAAKALDRIAEIHYRGGEYEKALELNEKRLAISKALNDKRSEAETLGDIARILKKSGDIEVSFKMHQEEKNVYEELGDEHSKAAAMGDIALILKNKGNVNVALSILENVIEIFDRLGDQRTKSIYMGDIARILVDKGEIEHALQILLERKKIFEVLGDRRSEAITDGDKARILLEKGNVEQALQMFQKKKKIIQELGDQDSIAVTLWDIASIELQQGNHHEAFKHLSHSYEINLKLGRLDGICFVGLDLGTLLCHTGQRDKGLPILQRSLEGFQKLGQTQGAEQTQAMIDQYTTTDTQSET